MLRVVPRKYWQIAHSIETLLDTMDLSIEAVTGWLKAVDDRYEPPESEQPLLSGGKLYFFEEQWLSRMKQRRVGGSSRPPKLNNGRRRPRGVRKKMSSTPVAKEGAKDDDRDRCRSCGLLGHWAKDYHRPGKV